MSDLLDRQTDRYLRGELTPAETRDLAQAALSDDALFDALAAHGAVEQSVKAPGFRAAISVQPTAIRSPRKSWALALAAVAFFAALALYLNLRTKSQPTQPIAAAQFHAVGKPEFIAKQFPANPDAPVFRSAAPDVRAPRPEGSIVAQDNFQLTVDLGSLDGLKKGAQLDVLRAGSKRPSGRLEVTTVFRDRARASIVSGAPREHDRVRAQPSAYLDAVVEIMDSNRGLGHEALNWAMANEVSMSQIRPLVDRLAQLDYQAADLATAQREYELILSNSPSPADRAIALNNLGAIAELQGQPITAQASYQEALRAIAEAAAPSARDRQVIEANLARLAGGAHEKH